MEKLLSPWHVSPSSPANFNTHDFSSVSLACVHVEHRRRTPPASLFSLLPLSSSSTTVVAASFFLFLRWRSFSSSTSAVTPSHRRLPLPLPPLLSLSLLPASPSTDLHLFHFLLRRQPPSSVLRSGKVLGLRRRCASFLTSAPPSPPSAHRQPRSSSLSDRDDRGQRKRKGASGGRERRRRRQRLWTKTTQ